MNQRLYLNLIISSVSKFTFFRFTYLNCFQHSLLVQRINKIFNLILFFLDFILISLDCVVISRVPACLAWLNVIQMFVLGKADLKFRKPCKCATQLFLPVLKPDLNDAHIETGVLRQLFPYVPRWFRTGVVCQLEGF